MLQSPNTEIFKNSIYDYRTMLRYDGVFYNAENNLLVIVYHRWEGLQAKKVKIIFTDADENKIDLTTLTFFRASFIAVFEAWLSGEKVELFEDRVWYYNGSTAYCSLYINIDGEHIYVDFNPKSNFYSCYSYSRTPLYAEKLKGKVRFTL